MAYVIYVTESTVLLVDKRYATKRAAKAALTRMDNRNELLKDTTKEDYSIATMADFYGGIEKQVTRKNLMSGKEYQEGINTPCYMSPSCESYWSM